MKARQMNAMQPMQMLEKQIKDSHKKKFGSAIILAGGKSSRMGFDKQKVRIGGISMVCYIAKQLEVLFDEIIIVTNIPGYYKEFDNNSAYIIAEDIYKGQGPLGGLHAGLLKASSEWAYITACDMPIVNTDYIQMMEEVLVKEQTFLEEKTLLKEQEEDQAVFSCVTRVKGTIEPFNAFYSTAKSGEVEKGILEGRLKFSRFVLENKSLVIDEEQALKYSKELTMFMNLNTLMNLSMNNLLEGMIDLPA